MTTSAPAGPVIIRGPSRYHLQMALSNRSPLEFLLSGETEPRRIRIDALAVRQPDACSCTEWLVTGLDVDRQETCIWEYDTPQKEGEAYTELDD